MFTFLENIVSFFGLIFTIIYNFFVSLVLFVTQIPTMVNGILSLIGVLPSFATVFVTFGITLTIVMFFLNREVGGNS